MNNSQWYKKKIQACDVEDYIYLTANQYAVLCWLINEAHEDNDTDYPHYFINDRDICVSRIAKDLNITRDTVRSILDVLKGNKLNKVEENRIRRGYYPQGKIYSKTMSNLTEEEKEKYINTINYRIEEKKEKFTYLEYNTCVYDNRQYWIITVPKVYIPLTINTLTRLLSEPNSGYLLYTLGYIYLLFFKISDWNDSHKKQKKTLEITVNEIAQKFCKSVHTEDIHRFENIIGFLREQGLISYNKLKRKNSLNGKFYHLYQITGIDIAAIDTFGISDKDLDTSERQNKYPTWDKEALEQYRRMRKEQMRRLNLPEEKENYYC